MASPPALGHTAPRVARLMSSSSSTQPAPRDPINNTRPQRESSASEAAPQSQHLALPSVAHEETGAFKTLDVAQDGSVISLDHLGPMVVNQDGTLSRITNWDGMSELEQKNTLRIVGKRNKQRLKALKAQEEGVELAD